MSTILSILRSFAGEDSPGGSIPRRRSIRGIFVRLRTSMMNVERRAIVELYRYSVVAASVGTLLIQRLFHARVGRLFLAECLVRQVS